MNGLLQSQIKQEKPTPPGLPAGTEGRPATVTTGRLRMGLASVQSLSGKLVLSTATVLVLSLALFGGLGWWLEQAYSARAAGNFSAERVAEILLALGIFVCALGITCFA